MNYTEENITNFENCCNFFEQNYTQEQLYNFLKNGTLAEKQLACIKIESINNSEEANILMQNLTGIDGKVREAVSFKLQTFINKRPDLFKQQNFYGIFLTSIIDINGNICRNIITALTNLTDDNNFCEYFTNKIIEFSHNVCDTIEKFNYKDRKYVTNKEIFKLYWYLETLSIFDKIPEKELSSLLERTAQIEEYTIREKTAQLLTKLTIIPKTIQNINYDGNFYVNLALLRK